MAYLKNYVLTHLKHWWMYIVSFFTSLFGLFVALLFVMRYLGAMDVPASINLVATSLTGSLIGALPILTVNYKVALNSKKQNLIPLTIINHCITIIVFYALMHFSLYWLIIDFRE